MQIAKILSDLDTEIAERESEINDLRAIRITLTRLKPREDDGPVATLKARKVRTPLAPVSAKRGRPKKVQPVVEPAKRKNNLSPEGRKRIQEVMRARWAKKNATKARG